MRCPKASQVRRSELKAQDSIVHLSNAYVAKRSMFSYLFRVVCTSHNITCAAKLQREVGKGRDPHAVNAISKQDNLSPLVAPGATSVVINRLKAPVRMTLESAS